MAQPAPRPRGNRLLTVTALVLAVFGISRLTHPAHAAGPPQPATAVVGHLPATATSVSVPVAAPAAMAYSVPVHIDIPAINVHAGIMTVGVNPDDTLGTPPLNNAKLAGWYDRGPTPGQAGSAIIDAHVDSALMKDYRGAFFTLGQAKPGMEIQVTRTDHTVAVFTIDEVQAALKTHFPSDKVYAPTRYPSLKLITCGGAFDYKTHEYLGNTIVYAHLTGEYPDS